MRLFTGLAIPQAIIYELERVVARLKPSAAIQWSPPANLHVTTKFIGEWPEERLEDLKAKLGSVPVHGPIEIEVRGLGWFPNPHRPRVFYAAIHAAEELSRLAAGTDAVCGEMGIEREGRPFSPHLTLARIRTPVSLEGLRQEVASLPPDPFGSFTSDSFYLYLSKTGPKGSIYTQLAEFPLNPK